VLQEKGVILKTDKEVKLNRLPEDTRTCVEISGGMVSELSVGSRLTFGMRCAQGGYVQASPL